MDALKRKMEIAAVAFFCTVTALIAVYSCATTAAANLAQQTAAAPVTEYVTLAYMEVQPETEQEPELLYDVPMSDELQRYVREQAERQGVPFEIALAVIERESSYQPDAVSDTGDFGLMQINVCNHRWLYEELGITDVMDPEQNVEAGLYILGQAFQKYDDPDKALMAYNMGDSGMKAAWSKGRHSTAAQSSRRRRVSSERNTKWTGRFTERFSLRPSGLQKSSRPESAALSPRWHWFRPATQRAATTLSAVSGLSCSASLCWRSTSSTTHFSRCSRTTERR